MEIFGIHIIEWMAYLASAIIVSSFLMKEIGKLRIVNSIGGLMFIAYGIFLDWAWPIVITNVVMVSINLFYTFKPKK